MGAQLVQRTVVPAAVAAQGLMYSLPLAPQVGTSGQLIWLAAPPQEPVPAGGTHVDVSEPTNALSHTAAG